MLYSMFYIHNHTLLYSGVQYAGGGIGLIRAERVWVRIWQLEILLLIYFRLVWSHSNPVQSGQNAFPQSMAMTCPFCPDLPVRQHTNIINIISISLHLQDTKRLS